MVFKRNYPGVYTMKALLLHHYTVVFASLPYTFNSRFIGEIIQLTFACNRKVRRGRTCDIRTSYKLPLLVYIDWDIGIVIRLQ